jgi:radical SAM superfamily enzyme YgiQ (UPF0313 family)
MNILLVYPNFPDTFWSFRYALKFIHKKASSPPLGLVTVAALLPDKWNKRLVDMNVSELKDDDLRWADYVFISAMVVQRQSAREVINRCKAQNIRLVAGGPLFTQEPDLFDDVDHLVLNEGEITLPKFIADLEAGYPQHVYSSSQYADMSCSPVPMWELVDRKKYDSLGIQFTRGCPFNCDFCNVTALLGHKPRLKNAEQIIAELDKIYSLGWRRNIFFVDDNFIGNKKVLKQQILPALIEWRKGKRGCQFITEASINLADDGELVELMVQAGFISVFVGIESPEEESLAECQKSQNTNRDLVESVKRLHRAGLQVMGGFIVGFDNDPPNIFQKQIDFIQKSGIITAMVGLLQAPYGTRLYQRLKVEGRVIDQISGDNVDGTTNIIPKMDLRLLKEGYRDILEQIYSPKLFYERAINFLQDYNPASASVHVEFQEILAFFRTVFRLGIAGVERTYYWRLVLWTLFRFPRKFPLAIAITIYGFHFRMVNEHHVSFEG